MPQKEEKSKNIKFSNTIIKGKGLIPCCRIFPYGAGGATKTDEVLEKFQGGVVMLQILDPWKGLFEMEL